jgi:chitinase
MSHEKKSLWRGFFAFLGLLGLISACSASNLASGAASLPPSPTPAPVPPRIIGYFTSWGVAGRGYTVSRIPAGQLTHINYAFAAISPLGKCALGDPVADTQRFYSKRDSVDQTPDVKDGPHGNFNQLLKLKKKYPDLKILISVGGWNGSGMFSEIAQDPTSRQKFVQSCLELYLDKWGEIFDGIDLDWEYPVSGGAKKGQPADKQNFTLLLEEFRKQLDAKEQISKKDYLLTIAAPAGPEVYKNLELDKIPAFLDWINIMTYDFHGAWDKTTNFNAPLHKSSSDPSKDPVVREQFNVEAAAQAYLKAGIPAAKLVVGVPFYGRGWMGVANKNNGLYQAASGPAKGNLEPGAFDYATIKKTFIPTYTRFWHEEAKVPWLYNPTTGIMISYDDPESVGEKADYVKENKLGGIMFWELSQDGGELLQAIYSRLYPE